MRPLRIAVTLLVTVTVRFAEADESHAAAAGTATPTGFVSATRADCDAPVGKPRNHQRRRLARSVSSPNRQRCRAARQRPVTAYRPILDLDPSGHAPAPSRLSVGSGNRLDERLFGSAHNPGEETALTQVAWRPGERWGFVARHHRGTSRQYSKHTTLRNYHVGADFWPGMSRTLRLQLSYVIADGHRRTYSGGRGFRSNAVLLQLHLRLE